MSANEIKTNSLSQATMSKEKGNITRYIKWGFIVLFIILTVALRLNLPVISIKAIMFVPMIVFAWIHGSQRYGVRTMIIWFVITWLVSNGFEALSIRTGFPFGHYHYVKMPGPRMLDVPVIIMALYFALSYTSWTVAQMVTGNFGKKIVGIYKIFIPITTAVIMSMFDLVGDPQASTVSSDWVWEHGGAYYGVPISNYAGWIFVVYVFMQIFTWFISKKNIDISKDAVTTNRSYWLEASIVYLSMGLGVVLEGFTRKAHVELYSSMAMISVFTMVFTAMISISNLKYVNNKYEK
ncbi:carotenoid biosynthesis protein [Pedobacter hartonius]|uniref:Putative membrane protein n=1 Tax=Pedobacter hartonius TaxID=425514 RepID=A0A1H4CNR9_9SPHI|nr:carotenoid biosynthesis protein [Pedobacter hartonius]SEA61722.1 putative membrane protein [Pedobacter hartonius]